MIISIASGKGGTGKTTVATALALSVPGPVQLLDCDVEEPNAHLFLKPEIKTSKEVSIPVPQIDLSKCDFCGKCAKVCAYNAIAVIKGKVLSFYHLCHGCGGCMLLCPKGAISETEKRIGVVEIGDSQEIQFIHGRLNTGEAMAPPLIRAVKELINTTRTVLIDAPPGTSCPVIAAVRQSDFCILVTEPTPFGLNDLVLAVDVIKKLGIKCGVVINRSDIGNDDVVQYCKKENIPVLMQIPFSRELAFAYSKGEVLIQANPSYKEKFRRLFEKIMEMAK